MFLSDLRSWQHQKVLWNQNVQPGKVYKRYKKNRRLKFTFQGQILPGWIHEVTPDGLWVHVSNTVRGRVFILDASTDLEILRNFSTHFRAGQSVKVFVLRVDVDKQELDLSIKVLKLQIFKANF